MLTDPEQPLAELAVLAEPVRRRLYLYVLSAADAVSRDAAAAAAGIGRPLAAFHLDRLVDAGLLTTEFRRLSGRSGPGAGRTSKLYRASRREVLGSAPPRRYDVAADLFAAAIDASPPTDAVLGRLAAERGRELGAEARRRAGGRAKSAGRIAAIETILREAGYAPFRSGDEIRLVNCPFDALAQHHRDVTCGMNLALIGGMLDGAGLASSAARLEFRPGLCCVAIGTGAGQPD
ncbi:MAG: helix-turn-helix transcriptional regulator [Candidatus Limnocylindria bacterium]